MNVTLRTRRSILAPTLAVALVTGFAATEAAAGKGDKILATVNGHRVRLRRALVCDGYTPAVVSMVGAQKPHRLGQTVRSLAVACAIDITTSAFPVSPEFCAIGYAEIKVKPGVPVKQWGGSNPDVQVTLEQFDGTVLVGTFSGPLQPVSGTTDPATVTNGRFSLVLGGDACTGPALGG